MSSWVLDSSALLALIHHEQGYERVAEAVRAGAVMSAVNISEVVAKMADSGLPETAIRDALGVFDLECAAFDEAAGFSAGLLRPASRAAGLSLGDRACVALGRERNLPVLTANRAWSGLDLGPGIEIVLLR